MRNKRYKESTGSGGNEEGGSGVRVPPISNGVYVSNVMSPVNVGGKQGMFQGVKVNASH